jgi:hypothetical protein
VTEKLSEPMSHEEAKLFELERIAPINLRMRYFPPSDANNFLASCRCANSLLSARAFFTD